jgi:hypothetical protein
MDASTAGSPQAIQNALYQTDYGAGMINPDTGKWISKPMTDAPRSSLTLVAVGSPGADGNVVWRAPESSPSSSVNVVVAPGASKVYEVPGGYVAKSPGGEGISTSSLSAAQSYAQYGSTVPLADRFLLSPVFPVRGGYEAVNPSGYGISTTSLPAAQAWAGIRAPVSVPSQPVVVSQASSRQLEVFPLAFGLRQDTPAQAAVKSSVFGPAFSGAPENFAGYAPQLVRMKEFGAENFVPVTRGYSDPFSEGFLQGLWLGTPKTVGEGVTLLGTAALFTVVPEAGLAAGGLWAASALPGLAESLVKSSAGPAFSRSLGETGGAFVPLAVAMWGIGRFNALNPVKVDVGSVRLQVPAEYSARGISAVEEGLAKLNPLRQSFPAGEGVVVETGSARVSTIWNALDYGVIKGAGFKSEVVGFEPFKVKFEKVGEAKIVPDVLQEGYVVGHGLGEFTKVSSELPGKLYEPGSLTPFTGKIVESPDKFVRVFTGLTVSVGERPPLFSLGLGEGGELLVNKFTSPATPTQLVPSVSVFGGNMFFGKTNSDALFRYVKSGDLTLEQYKEIARNVPLMQEYAEKSFASGLEFGGSKYFGEPLGVVRGTKTQTAIQVNPSKVPAFTFHTHPQKLPIPSGTDINAILPSAPDIVVGTRGLIVYSSKEFLDFWHAKKIVLEGFESPVLKAGIIAPRDYPGVAKFVIPFSKAGGEVLPEKGVVFNTRVRGGSDVWESFRGTLGEQGAGGNVKFRPSSVFESTVITSPEVSKRLGLSPDAMRMQARMRKASDIVLKISEAPYLLTAKGPVKTSRLTPANLKPDGIISTEFKTMTEPQAKKVLEGMRANQEGLDEVFGSSSFMSQLKPEVTRPRGDIEALYRDAELSGRAARLGAIDLLETGGKQIRVSGSTTEQLVPGGKEVTHTLDFHSQFEDILGSGARSASESSGLAYGRPLVGEKIVLSGMPSFKSKEQVGVRLSLDQLLAYRRSEKGVILGPAAHRAKTSPDLYRGYKTALESEYLSKAEKKFIAEHAEDVREYDWAQGLKGKQKAEFNAELREQYAAIDKGLAGEITPVRAEFQAVRPSAVAGASKVLGKAYAVQGVVSPVQSARSFGVSAASAPSLSVGSVGSVSAFRSPGVSSASLLVSGVSVPSLSTPSSLAPSLSVPSLSAPSVSFPSVSPPSKSPSVPSLSPSPSISTKSPSPSVPSVKSPSLLMPSPSLYPSPSPFSFPSSGPSMPAEQKKKFSARFKMPVMRKSRGFQGITADYLSRIVSQAQTGKTTTPRETKSSLAKFKLRIESGRAYQPTREIESGRARYLPFNFNRGIISRTGGRL